MLPKRLLIIWLSIACMIGSLFDPVLIGNKTASAASGLNFSNAYIKPYAIGNKRYAVGFMSYEIWTNSSGTWTTKSPGDSVNLSYTYSFDFPGRSVKSVKVASFQNSEPDITYFKKSRSTDDYMTYQLYFAQATSAPSVSDVIVKGSSTNFTVNMSGILATDSTIYYNVIAEEHAGEQFADLVQARRYYYPVLFEIELYGQAEINYFATDGTRIAPTETVDMTIGQSYLPAPKVISGYTYANQYKKTLDGSDPSGTSKLSGQPSFVYDGSFDMYRVNYYYDKSADGKAYIRHVDRNGQPISALASQDRDVELYKNKSFSPNSAAAPTGYKYAGYAKTTTGKPPSAYSISNPTAGEYAGFPSYDGTFNVYLDYVYDLVATPGTVHVRQMVRKDASSPYVMKDESVQSVPLPYDQTYTADEAKYGKFIGQSRGNTGYNNTVSVISGKSITVNLKNPDAKEAYLSFYYEEKPQQGSFTGDFDVNPSTINYKDPFTLHPKDFVMNTCVYTGHQYKITRDGMEYTTSVYTSKTSDTTFPYSSYPFVIGVGTHQISMRIFTSNCGESEWGPPKTLTVTGPSNNSPPTFQIAWVRPSEPLKPVYEALEGEVLNLVVIQDPSVPTPNDPDGDDIYFGSFDFSNSTSWAQQIPSKYPGGGWMAYTGVKMDGIGTHPVKATMHDQFGASATASTYVTVRPPNPIPVIQGPKQVIEGRPLPSAFNADGSYSPVGRSIDHTRDEWTNLKAVYMYPGTEKITLDVYDSIGLKSVSPAVHELKVLEDMPPVVGLKGALSVIRNSPFHYVASATSPDGDVIVKLTITRKYDSDNDGDFNDETGSAVTYDSSKAFDYTYPKVGTYEYRICATEDWGKSACSSYFVDVLNDSPTVSFDISSLSSPPSLIVPTPIKASDIASSIGWKNTDYSTANKPMAWVASTSGKLGTVPYNEYKYSDYRALTAGTAKVTTYTRTSGQLFSKCCSTFNFDNFVWLGNDYYAQTASSGGTTFVIDIYKYNAAAPYGYDYIQRREANTANGLTWKEEKLVDVDLFNNLVTTYVYEYDQRTYTYTEHKAYYTVDSFVNPSGKPFQIDGAAPMTNSTNFAVNFYFMVGLFNHLTYGLDAGGAYVTMAPWDFKNRGNTSKLYLPLNCSTNKYCGAPTSNDTRGLTYTGNYITYNQQAESNHPIGFYEINGKTFVSKLLAPSGIYWVGSYIPYFVSPDGKYAVYSSGSLTWDLVDLMTGAVTSNVFASTKPRLNGIAQYKDIIVFSTNDGSGLRAYQIGKTLTPIWSQSKTPSILGGGITNDGKMYVQDSTQWSSTFNVQTLDLKTGTLNTLASIDASKLGLEVGYWSSAGTISVGSFKQISDDSFSFIMSYSPNSGSDYRYYTYLIKGAAPSEDIDVGTQNQLLNDTQYTNTQLQYSVRAHQLRTDGLYAGYGYRMQDNENGYRVEQNRNKIRLVKVVNRQRTILKEADFAVDEGEWSTIKIITQDDRHKVYINGVPLIDVRDATFTKGYFGPYTEIPKTEFKALSYADLDIAAAGTVLRNIAIVGKTADYNTQYTDSENDPAIVPLTKWSYVKTEEKFLDSGDGKSGASALNGRTFTTPQTVFDKVGVYRVSYSTVDDPMPNHLYPDMLFADARKESNTYVQDIIVHRPPISLFTLLARADGTIQWTDNSYDPDRYLSPTNYSTENTGIDYFKTHGVVEKKFYYITPSGVMVKEKLVSPQEVGKYEVGMAVRDEYGAWSDYYVQYIDAGKVAAPNTPPVPGFTSNYINTFRGVEITFDSFASDAEDGDRTKLPHEYYISNVTNSTPEYLQSTSRTSWTKTFNTIGTFNIRQVVEDSLGVTAQYELQVNIHNRLPSAVVTNPSSTDQAKPTKFTTTQPTFTWTYGDADGDEQKQYQLRIYRYGGVIQADTNTRVGSTVNFTPNAELPEKVNMYVVVRVFDGYDWSDWSDPKYFYIETNRPPVADFDWTPKPVYEGDAIKLVNNSSDPDNDPLTEKWVVVSPSGTSQTYTSTPTLSSAAPGDYKVTLTVSDGKAADVSVTKTIQVLPLSITGSVSHTTTWLENLNAYNAYLKTQLDNAMITREQYDQRYRNLIDFWAGERFVLGAQTTAINSGSSVVAQKVWTKVSGSAYPTSSSSPWYNQTGMLDRSLSRAAAADRWKGEVNDPYKDIAGVSSQVKLESLQNGYLDFTFYVLYSNGTIKQDTVRVYVKNKWDEFYRIHRVQ
jgi:hypothetical protein